ncbi:MAG: nitrogen regulatory protein P-II 1 [Kiritimatiellia bacterium]|jgi:nitrogen regulatory protein P-II 1
MKLITAIIRPERLDVVREALLHAEITRITVSRCTGHGRAVGDVDLYRGNQVSPDLIPKTRLEIVVNDAFVKAAVDAIMSSAQSDKIGDGKIIVQSIDEVYRIRTGESGGDAV